MSGEIPQPSELSSGTEIFGYVIDRLLGRGGMGNVYLAKQTSLDRQVALKVMHPQRLRAAGAAERFLGEARAAAKLNHPNLVAVHDVMADPERKLYAYSMEFVPGTTAAKLVMAQGTLKRAQALHLTFQVAKALAHAHKHGLIHRDVKPDNILITQGGSAKLLDLGLVHDRIQGPGPGQGEANGSRVLSIVGTVEFSAPEQHRNPRQAVPASDVYSLGATLFYLLAGRPPFSGDTIIDLIVRVATEPLSYPAAVPSSCRRLLDLMLAKRPADRFADGEAVVEALKAIAEGRAPSINAPGEDGTTTDLGADEDDEGFEDAETEGGISATELPVEGDQSSRASARRPRVVRRRRR